ncbi:MAG: bifunctional folylpolyglutamate synthase/dihydrofolate synthase [Proteobacteria bacterium]|nr:bifunctional folylpolyglutamate synthase/dihydrofolate synthase [Pseudomonadota bacterium]
MLANDLHQLSRLDPSKIDLGLDKTRSLLERLGNPHERFKSIHIAGTNGKGSTAAFISSILTASGYRTALYTSPHLETFSERIKIDDKHIAQHKIDEISVKVRKAAEQMPSLSPTYFEFATALAFVYFAEMDVDFAVIETGLGGRLDATNILSPLVSVITPVSMDHADYLGDSLDKVAMEKAGIIKEDTPVVMSGQVDIVASVIKKVASEKKAPLLVYGRDFQKINVNDDFRYRGREMIFEKLRSSLYGDHQKENATVALAALEVLTNIGVKLYERDVQKGIRDAYLPGRFEVVTTQPYVILDGAHNPEGARMLVNAIKGYFQGASGTFVVAFMEDKDVDGILQELTKVAAGIILTRSCHERAFNADVKISFASDLVKKYGLILVPDFTAAIRKGMALAKTSSFLTITGSLYAVGEAKTLLREAI